MSHPNMSYCMFQNTLLAMRQLLGAMEDEGVELLNDLSREERRAFDEMFNACESFTQLAEELQAEFEDCEPAE